MEFVEQARGTTLSGPAEDNADCLCRTEPWSEGGHALLTGKVMGVVCAQNDAYRGWAGQLFLCCLRRGSLRRIHLRGREIGRRHGDQAWGERGR
jgi:hypothetical protein